MKTIVSLLIAAALFVPSSGRAAQPDPLPTPPDHSNAGGNQPAGTLSLVFNVAQAIANVGTLTGTLTVDGFIVDGGVIKAEGSLDATITDAAGTEVGSVTDLEVLLPLTSTTGTTSEVLLLTLGPVEVDVDGTVVTLAAITLEVDAEASSHRAFGRLLALVDRTLKREGASNRQISRLLNVILRFAKAE
jgi:hypothetical protein